jgi:hypothetical protein
MLVPTVVNMRVNRGPYYVVIRCVWAAYDAVPIIQAVKAHIMGQQYLPECVE